MLVVTMVRNVYHNYLSLVPIASNGVACYCFFYFSNPPIRLHVSYLGSGAVSCVYLQFSAYVLTYGESLGKDAWMDGWKDGRMGV